MVILSLIPISVFQPPLSANTDTDCFKNFRTDVKVVQVKLFRLAIFR